MADSVAQKIVQNTFEGIADVKKGLQDESSMWGKTAWDAIMGPSDPQAAAEAKQQELVNKQKESQRAAEWRRYFQVMAENDARLRQQLAQKKQIKQAETIQEERVKESKEAVKVQKDRQLSAAELAERASEIKGQSVGG